MKRILLFSLLVINLFTAFSQSDSSAPYRKAKGIPEFRMLNNDSAVFTQNILQKDKATIFMLFNPECDHCQKQLDLILSVPEVAEKAQLVMASIETLDKNRKFYTNNHLEKYPFIHLGKDFAYIFGPFFEPNTVPMLAFYNRKGEFVLKNNGNTKKEKILEGIRD